MDKLPNDILLNIVLFLGNNNDIEKTKMLLPKKLYKSNIDNLLNYVVSRAVKRNDYQILIEVSPRRKISLMKNEKNKIIEVLKNTFFSDNSNLPIFIKNMEKKFKKKIQM